MNEWKRLKDNSFTIWHSILTTIVVRWRVLILLNFFLIILIEFWRLIIYKMIILLKLTSVPNPLKNDSICARSWSVISAIEFVSKLKLSKRKSKLSTISECAFLSESNCHSWPDEDTSYVSDPSEMSLDGVLLSLSEFKRRRGKCAIYKDTKEYFFLINLNQLILFLKLF